MTTAFLGGVPYGIGAITLGILVIKGAGENRIKHTAGWVVLLSGIMPLLYWGSFVWVAIFE
jgi:hypothetical protein